MSLEDSLGAAGWRDTWIELGFCFHRVSRGTRTDILVHMRNKKRVKKPSLEEAEVFFP